MNSLTYIIANATTLTFIINVARIITTNVASTLITIIIIITTNVNNNHNQKFVSSFSYFNNQ